MTELGEGERREARRRKLFWGILGIIAVGGALAGFFAGVTAAVHDVGYDEIWTTIPQPLLIGLVALSFVAFSYGCWRFYQAIDEVELVDNLWGSTAAYYVYATLFPLWWVLAKARIVPEPSDWAIYFAALGGGMLIYLWRKWRAR